MSNSENSNLNSLVNALSEDLKPIEKARHPLVYTLPWLIITAIFAFIAVKHIGVRHDAIEKLHDSVFLFEITVVAALALSATIASAYLMAPDMRGKKWLIPVTLTISFVFAMWNFIKSYTEGFQSPQLRFDHCMQEGMFMALIPMMALIFFVRSGATTKPIIMGAMNLLAGASVAYIGLRFTCVMDTVGHVLILHLTPYIVLGGVIGLIARRLYKW